MDKTVVIFESKYGFTERYAEWIADALSCPLFEKKNFHPQELTHYNTVIYGGGLYAGGVSGIKLLTRNWQLLRGKQVILFTCGLADPSKPENVRHIREALAKTLSPEMMDMLHIFHFQGGIAYSRLSFLHKSMMGMLRKMLLKKNPQVLDEESRLLLKTYGQNLDFTVPESIQPLIAYVTEPNTDRK